MHRAPRTLPDGTRWYANGHYYKPLAPEQRKYGVNKPDDPDAVRFNGRWFLPLQLLDDEQRVMPETRPDHVTLEHKALCKCDVCKRPAAADWWRKRRRWEKSGLVPEKKLSRI